MVAQVSPSSINKQKQYWDKYIIEHTLNYQQWKHKGLFSFQIFQYHFLEH